MRQLFPMRYQNVQFQSTIHSPHDHGMGTTTVNALIKKCRRLSSYELVHLNSDTASVPFLSLTFHLQYLSTCRCGKDGNIVLAEGLSYQGTRHEVSNTYK